MNARIYKILKHTKVEGPGIRYCIWFQGCSRHCIGCWAKATWDLNGGTLYNTEDIVNDILLQKDIEGVTFLGGEPFEQPTALEYIAKEVKKAGLSVICFTGNKIEEIEDKYKNILKYIDLLIDGEYQENKKDFSRPWVGSSNQRYHFLTDRYNKDILKEYKNKIEINIQKNGMIFINGMGDFEEFSKGLNMPQNH